MTIYRDSSSGKLVTICYLTAWMGKCSPRHRAYRYPAPHWGVDLGREVREEEIGQRYIPVSERSYP
jgi:hypothetical protein